MKVSVVVPAYNAEKTIRKCLDSLIAQSFADYEIIIVDNASCDGTFRIVEEFIKIHPEKKIKLVREKERSSTAARNRGTENSSGDIIAFTDSDCVAERNWLRDVISAFDKEEIGAVAGNIRGYKPHNLVEKFLSGFTLRGLREEGLFSRYTLLEGGFATANLSVRKDLLNKVNGFQGPVYGDDHDLCARLYGLGVKIKYVTNALVFHIHRSTFWGFVGQSFNFGTAHAYLLRKWGTHRLIVEFPKYTYQNLKFAFPIWLNLKYADKKMAMLVILGFLNPLLFLLPIIYYIYLAINMQKEYKKDKMKVSFPEGLGLAFLLLIKSMAMTGGRIVSSFKNRVICV